MRERTETVWQTANEQYLMGALSEVRLALEAYLERTPSAAPGAAGLQELAAAMPSLPALESLCEIFGLTGFERGVLLLAAGFELDPGFAGLCEAALSQAHSHTPGAGPTFGLALAALPGAHWSALSPAAPLRYWRLAEVGDGETLTSSPLRLDERVLHHLAGLRYLDERLAGLVEPAPEVSEPVPSHRELAGRAAAAWSQAAPGAALPAVELCGPDRSAALAVAGETCRSLGLGLYCLTAVLIPANPPELDALLRLWGREAALSGSALFLDRGEAGPGEPSTRHALHRLVEGVSGPLIVYGRERLGFAGRAVQTFDVSSPTPDEQRVLWRKSLGAQAETLNGAVEALAAQFNLSASALRAASARALSGTASAAVPGAADPGSAAVDAGLLGVALWEAARQQTRPQLGGLLQPIRPLARREDLVLPAAQKQVLAEIAAHVRQRLRVYESWGFAGKSQRGLGISALFAGASGTGKTMAAEVLANELQLDLYRIDLSQVVSKYIGETEKNLGRVFDAAEAGGAILLFDEADALFGKRSEVKDSHDRYANIEISYLLQRMEAYRGLAILTTNAKDALDTAFLRRIRFIVRFPFPDAAERAEIWRRIFPAETPVEGLEIDKLARLNLAGGSIRNVALYAAFLSAESGGPVGMAHLRLAAQREYAKLEKPLPEAEIRDWT